MNCLLKSKSEKVKSDRNTINAVCIYCASSTKIDRRYFEVAGELGEKLADLGIEIINGAGGIGLMREISDAAMGNGGTVTGVIPQFMVEQGWHHRMLTRLIVTENMHERKETMARMSDAIIALPGGCGTMEELLEIITWKQLGLYLKPIVILNINGFYDPLLEMLDRAIEQNFMREQHRALWHVADTVDEAIELIYTIPEWDVNLRKFAAI